MRQFISGTEIVGIVIIPRLSCTEAQSRDTTRQFVAHTKKKKHKKGHFPIENNFVDSLKSTEKLGKNIHIVV